MRRRASFCSTAPTARPVSPSAPRACGKTVCRLRDCPSSRPKAAPIVGSVRLWDVSAGSGRRALMLGPLAVSPDHQSSGIGAKLMKQAIATARMRGHGAILLVGDAPYYGRFGFSAEKTGLAGDARSLPAGPAARRSNCNSGALDGASGMIGATGRLRAEARTGCAGRDGFPPGCQKPDIARSVDLHASSLGGYRRGRDARPFHFLF